MEHSLLENEHLLLDMEHLLLEKAHVRLEMEHFLFGKTTFLSKKYTVVLFANKLHPQISQMDADFFNFICGNRRHLQIKTVGTRDAFYFPETSTRLQVITRKLL